MLTQVLVIVGSLALGQTATSDEEAVRDVFKQVVAAQNAKDAKAVAAFFAEDGDFVTLGGSGPRGDRKSRISLRSFSGPMPRQPSRRTPQFLSASCRPSMRWRIMAGSGLEFACLAKTRRKHKRAARPLFWPRRMGNGPS